MEVTSKAVRERRICRLIQGDCLEVMKKMPDNCIDLTLTDIPYNEINRDSNGLRKLNKELADVITFDLTQFLQEVYRVTRGTIIIFCGRQQVSDIGRFFQEKQDNHIGTVRQLIWQKTNPSPMNGQHIYLSGIENAIWFKKRGAVFNAHCKNTVFTYPCGRSKYHPTEKNRDLMKELLLDNSNENQIVFDPCMGSGTTGIICLKNNRNFIGVELDENYFKIAKNRIEETQKSLQN
jgi:site-specific DNA-methyltransferase (adenine-specific)